MENISEGDDGSQWGGALKSTNVRQALHQNCAHTSFGNRTTSTHKPSEHDRFAFDCGKSPQSRFTKFGGQQNARQIIRMTVVPINFSSIPAVFRSVIYRMRLALFYKLTLFIKQL